MIHRQTITTVTHLLKRVGWFEIEQLRLQLRELTASEVQELLTIVVQRKSDIVQNKHRRKKEKA